LILEFLKKNGIWVMSATSKVYGGI
jgi:hypothetical protein